MEAAEFCLGFDRQLDLAGALPLKASAKSSAAAGPFVRQRLITTFDSHVD